MTDATSNEPMDLAARVLGDDLKLNLARIVVIDLETDRVSQKFPVDCLELFLGRWWNMEPRDLMDAEARAFNEKQLKLYDFALPQGDPDLARRVGQRCGISAVTLAQIWEYGATNPDVREEARKEKRRAEESERKAKEPDPAQLAAIAAGAKLAAEMILGQQGRGPEPKAEPDKAAPPVVEPQPDQAPAPQPDQQPKPDAPVEVEGNSGGDGKPDLPGGLKWP